MRSWPLIPALVVLTAGSQARAADPSGELVLSIRRPLAFLSISPTGGLGAISSSETIRVVGELLAKHTDLSPIPLDPGLVADCKGKLACFARRLEAEAQGAGQAELLLVLSNLTQESGVDRLSLVLVHLQRAIAIATEPAPSDPALAEEWAADVEVRIVESAVLARPRLATIATEAEMRAFLERAFTEELRPGLEEAGAWAPYGAIELEAPEPGVAVEVDGTTAGITRAGITRIGRVPAGRRLVRLSHPRYATFETELVVARGETTQLRVDLAGASGPASPLRSVLFWSGTAATVAGAALATFALVRSDGDVSTLCLVRAGQPCGGSGFMTTGYDPSRAPTFSDDVNPGGLLLGPLGYSVALTGATWAISTLLFGEPEDGPWLQVAAGIAVGAAAYGLSAALDGDSFPR